MIGFRQKSNWANEQFGINRGAVMQIGVDTQRSIENKRVFVIDNNEINSMALQFMLADENETHTLPQIAVAIDKAREWPPHLVLLGVDLVRAEGAALIGKIKSSMNSVKILLVCDSADDVSVKEALLQGADGTLLTPLTIEGVRRKVNSALGRAVPLGIPVVLR
jgi:DNA-binding response OmpR family regulator